MLPNSCCPLPHHRGPLLSLLRAGAHRSHGWPIVKADTCCLEFCIISPKRKTGANQLNKKKKKCSLCGGMYIQRQNQKPKGRPRSEGKHSWRRKGTHIKLSATSHFIERPRRCHMLEQCTKWTGCRSSHLGIPRREKPIGFCCSALPTKAAAYPMEVFTYKQNKIYS